MKKLLSFLIFILLCLPGFSTVVSTYEELSTAVANNDTVIELSNDITFGAPLTISTNTVLNSIFGSSFTITGSSATAPVLTFTGPTSTISNITFSSTTQTMSSSSTVFINIAELSAGQSYSTFNIINVNFENNIVSTDSAHGGALLISTHQGVNIENTIFSTNSALGAGALGGALYYEGDDGFVGTKLIFSTNTVQQDGGGVYMSSGTVRGSTFSGNSALTGNGGAIYASTLTLKGYTSQTISSTTITTEHIYNLFENNYAGNKGGAIYINNWANIEETDFYDNISTNTATTGSGGAIYAATGSTVTINNTYVFNNWADFGGAFYNEGEMNISDAAFSHNTANADGGLIYNTGTLVISSSTIYDSYSYTKGGAIYTTGETTIDNSNFLVNEAVGNGGAIYVDNTTLNLNGEVNFVYNTSSGLGGAIYVDNGTLNLNPAGATMLFGGNTDSSGDNDIYLNGTSTMNILGSGTVEFYGGVKGGSITSSGTALNWYVSNAYDGTLDMTNGSLGIFDDNANFGAVTLNDTSLNLKNGSIGTLNTTSLTTTGDVLIYVDADPFSGTIDTISNAAGATFTINEYDQVNILEDYDGVSPDLVIAPGATVNVNTTEDFYGPLFIYNLQSAAGGFNTIKTSRMNPTVSVLPIAANSKIISNLNTTSGLYNRIDIMFSRDLLNYIRPDDPSELFYGPKVNPDDPIKKGPVPTQSKHFMAWFIPNVGYQKTNYGEEIQDVSNLFYGGIVGIDFPFAVQENSFFVPTIFMGYLGSKKKYNGVTSYSDSLAFGLMATWKNERALLSAQTYVTNGPETYSFKKYGGSFDVFSYTASVKGELGLEITENIVLQPALTFFYNLSSLQNYVTANGADVYSTRFQNILLTPSVKIMGSYRGWYPYLSGGYNFNAWQKGVFSANAAVLPEYKLKNITELSAGVENTFFKDYSGYVQVSTYLGGAKGFAFQMGLRGYID